MPTPWRSSSSRTRTSAVSASTSRPIAVIRRSSRMSDSGDGSGIGPASLTGQWLTNEQDPEQALIAEQSASDWSATCGSTTGDTTMAAAASRYEIAHLAHAEMYTADLEGSLSFFQQLLGMRETARQGDSVYLR